MQRYHPIYIGTSTCSTFTNISSVATYSRFKKEKIWFVSVVLMGIKLLNKQPAWVKNISVECKEMSKMCPLWLALAFSGKSYWNTETIYENENYWIKLIPWDSSLVKS